ncbi:MAG: choline dehydrogenase [Solirubrobacteraceae bacterium]|jgi:choline dehydrogenase|nr:choline dehydrogenase [Solirubrobacteraceae bacterium]
MRSDSTNGMNRRPSADDNGKPGDDHRRVDDFDYVIVGAGSAGCVLAARLSEDPDARVLLLEAGGEASGVSAIADPRLWPTNAKTDVDWGYDTEVQPGTGRSHPFARGRVVGGSSAINGMIFLRGDPTVYDAWASAGNPGWDFESVLPYFKRSETVQGRDRRFRGSEGPLRPAPVARPHPIARSFIDACVEVGHPRADDVNGASRDGVALHDLNIVDGVRQSAADAYLTAAVRARPNLVIESGTRVLRLLLKSDRCAGVGVVADGVQRDIHAAEEVILSAGVIDTPRLLMLSGIGPADELTEVGIAVAVDLPAVGRNLQDHTVTGLIYEARRTIPPATANHGEASLLWRSSAAEPACDLHLVMCDVPITSMPTPANCCTLLVANVRPASRGLTRLRSADPTQPPLIAPNFLGEESDLEKVLLGLATAREIAAAPAFGDWGLREVLPGADARAREALTVFVRAATETYNHASGTCRMGPGADSVVDSTLKVHGVEALRIADASIVPTIPNANTHATVVMIGEKAAGLIREPAAGPSARGSAVSAS